MAIVAVMINEESEVVMVAVVVVMKRVVLF